MMNRTILALCLAVGIVSLFNGQYLVSAASQDPYAAICNSVTKNKAQTSAFLTKLNSEYGGGKGTTTFPLTVAYVTSAAYGKQLLAGGQSCINALIGLEAPLVADLTTDGVKVTNAKQAVLQQIINYFPQMAGHLH